MAKEHLLMWPDTKIAYDTTMGTPSFSIDDEVLERVNSRLSYGDSRSKWMENAAKLRIQIDPMLDEVYEAHQSEERIEFVEEAVRKEIDRRKQNSDWSD